MEKVELFFVVTPTVQVSGGLTVGGAVRVALDGDKSALLAFTSAGVAEEYRTTFGLTQATVLPLTEIKEPSLPQEALVFSSLRELMEMRAHAATFPFREHLVPLAP